MKNIIILGATILIGAGSMAEAQAGACSQQTATVRARINAAKNDFNSFFNTVKKCDKGTYSHIAGELNGTDPTAEFNQYDGEFAAAQAAIDGGNPRGGAAALSSVSDKAMARIRDLQAKIQNRRSDIEKLPSNFERSILDDCKGRSVAQNAYDQAKRLADVHPAYALREIADVKSCAATIR